MIPQSTRSKKTSPTFNFFFVNLLSCRRTKKGRVNPVEQERKPVVLHLAQVGSVLIRYIDTNHENHSRFLLLVYRIIFSLKNLIF